MTSVVIETRKTGYFDAVFIVQYRFLDLSLRLKCLACEIAVYVIMTRRGKVCVRVLILTEPHPNYNIYKHTYMQSDAYHSLLATEITQL